MRSKSIVFVLIVALVAVFIASPAPSPAAAQQNVCTASNTLSIPDSATGSINNTDWAAFFCFEGRAGDTVTISMTATSGNLDPYLLVFDTAIETLYAENDDIASGNTNSSLTFSLPETTTYVIAAARFGLEEGSSTGGFTIDISGSGTSTGLGNGGTTDPASFEFPAIGDGTGDAGLGDGAITVTCDTGEVANGGVQFSFINVNPGFSYTATALGIDGFDPVVTVETRPGIGTCNDDNTGVAGSRVDVPGYGNVFSNTTSAQVRFTSPGSDDPVNITVGSFTGQSGRFVLIIEGFAISPATELDGFSVRVPQAAQEEPLGVYMVARFTDLDPYLYIATGEGLNDAYAPDGTFFPSLVDFNEVFGPIYECDDAGRGDCSFSPNFEDGNILISNGSSYNPGSVDAGLMLTPNTTDPILYVFGSLNGNSSGTYAILVTGFVPGN